jgi:hypothetical protein
LKLEKRLKAFLELASPAELTELETAREQFQEALKTATDAKAARYPEYGDGQVPLSARFKRACANTSGFINQYTQMLDLVVGIAPDYVSAAYGAIKIIFVAQVNHQETKQKIQNYLDQITIKFEIMDSVIACAPTTKLLTCLERAYNMFTLFLSKAVQFYTQSRISMTGNEMNRRFIC